MRVLSIRQPWASLIASGRKTIELRTWSTNYRGPVLIVAGSAPWRGDHGHELGPMGVSICVVDLVDVAEFDPRDARATAVPRGILAELPPQFAWRLSRPRPVPHEPVKGKLGLYRPDERLTALAVGM